MGSIQFSWPSELISYESYLCTGLLIDDGTFSSSIWISQGTSSYHGTCVSFWKIYCETAIASVLERLRVLQERRPDSNLGDGYMDIISGKLFTEVDNIVYHLRVHFKIDTPFLE